MFITEGGATKSSKSITKAPSESKVIYNAYMVSVLSKAENLPTNYKLTLTKLDEHSKGYYINSPLTGSLMRIYYKDALIYGQ